MPADPSIGPRVSPVPGDATASPRRVAVLPPGPAIVYVGGLVVFSVWGLYGPFLKTLVAGLFLIATVTRRVETFVRDWAVFLAGIALFDSLRAVVLVAIDALGLPLHMDYVIRLERALFDGQTLPTLVQAALIRKDAPGLFEYVLVVVHASHFVVFLLFGVGLWFARRKAFGRFAVAMLLVMGLGIVGFLVVPTVPPWMAADLHAIPPIDRVADGVYGRLVPSLRRAFDTNPVAAMPSLHAAFAALCTLVAFHHFGAWGWLAAAYLALAGLSAVALGEHYFLDLVAGGLLAAGVYWLVYRSPRRARPHPPAPDPRGATGRRLVLATALLLLAAGVSQVTLHFRRPFTLSEAFGRLAINGRRDLGPHCERC
jgi:membrane-associated phospholipid phosphatase